MRGNAGESSGSRAGVGNFQLNFSPTSDKQIEEAIRRHPKAPAEPSLFGFLRRDPGTAKPGAPFVVTDRPEGYWLLEHPEFLTRLKGA